MVGSHQRLTRQRSIGRCSFLRADLSLARNIFLSLHDCRVNSELSRKATKMHLAGYVTVLFALVVFSAISVFGFPDGAPVDACVKPRPNQPYHGEARSQPLSTSPYKILASSSQYGPGSQITVTIAGAAFKGFMLQARDSSTNGWIGSWARTPNTNVHSECSAVTHADPRDKEQATFIWNAPANARGSVYFTGSVLKDYATFWADLVSQTQ